VVAVVACGAGRLTFGGVPENDARTGAFREPKPDCAVRSVAISGKTSPNVTSIVCSLAPVMLAASNDY
jgi:hypothetical protein